MSLFELFTFRQIIPPDRTVTVSLISKGQVVEKGRRASVDAFFSTNAGKARDCGLW